MMMLMWCVGSSVPTGSRTYFMRCLRSSPEIFSRLILARLCVPSLAFSSFSARFSFPT
jgi:hypothetical protein